MRTKVKTKKDSCILQIDNIKLIAKNPSIQPFHEYIYNDTSDIMYFYYDLILKKKNYKGKWKTVAKTYVTEFGIMQNLAEAIKEVLSFDVKSKGIIYHPAKKVNGYVLTSVDDYIAYYPFQIAGLLNEDRFEIIKEFKTFKDCRGINEFETYDLNIFIGGNELSKNPIGVHIPRLEKENLEKIILFANSFMDMASQKAKEEVQNTLSDETDDEYNYPKIVRDYLKSEHNIDDWKPIFLKLSTKEYVLEEFIEYITGNKTIDELGCHEWHNENRTIQELLKTLKDYEAYLHIIDDNN